MHLLKRFRLMNLKVSWMICVSIGELPFERAMEIARASEMIEIRQDLAGYSISEMVSLVQAAPKAVFTCRPTDDGNEEDRLLLYGMAIDAGAAYIDLELEADDFFLGEIKRILKSTQTNLILSWHNYNETPSAATLTEILENCYSRGAAVAKIASFVNSPGDVNALLSLYNQKGRKVVLGMGEGGILTRVAAVPLGAEFTFASPGKENKTAPGQLTEAELREIYQILKI